jgi:hypothetical protein
MIINHRYRFIFIHVPKTAGSSVTNWLSRFNNWNDIELGGTRYGEAIQPVYGERFKLYKHSTARQIRDVVGDDLWRSYFKFAVVRHPLARLASAYRFYRQWPHPSVAEVREMTDINEFVHSEFFAKDHQARPGVALQKPAATVPQSVFIDPGDDSPLDMVCHFERLQADLERVARQLGLLATPLPHLNSSNSQDLFYDAYTPESRRYALAIYAEDMERFGYSRA